MRQTSCALGHLGWKVQPGGGAAGLGGSPSRTIRSRRRSAAGSGSGTADSSALV